MCNSSLSYSNDFAFADFLAIPTYILEISVFSVSGLGAIRNYPFYNCSIGYCRILL